MAAQKRLSGRRIVALIAVGFLAFPPHATALEETAGPIRKLGRGLANVATSVFEIQPRVTAVYYEYGAAGALSWGALEGLQAAFIRASAGLVEVVTFLFPLPDFGYGPLVEPEFLFSPEVALEPWEEGKSVVKSQESEADHPSQQSIK